MPTFTSIWFVWTHVDLKKLLPLRSQVERNAIHVAGQGGSPDQQDDENAIREKSGEVDELPKRLDSLPERAVDEGPGKEKAASQLKPYLPDVMNAIGDVKHEVTVMEERGESNKNGVECVFDSLKEFVRWHFSISGGLRNVLPHVNGDVLLEDTLLLIGHDSPELSAVLRIESPACLRVPRIVTRGPRQARGERRKDVEESPTYRRDRIKF